MKPTTDERGNSIHYTWADAMVAVVASRVKEDKYGKVTAELKITTSAPGYAEHLHQALVNLSSTQTRASLAKHLSQVYEQAEWTSIIEQVAVYTTDWIRRGEPVIDLWGDDDAEPPEYLIDPLIVKGYPNIIFGDPGTFKSAASVVVAAILSLPWNDNPLIWPTPKEAHKVLYLDWETDWQTVNWTFHRIRIGSGLQKFPLKYRRCFQPLASDIETIMSWADDCEADTLIIDSLGLAAGDDDLNKSTPATNFYRSLRHMNRTSIILAHNSKDKESKQRSIIGHQTFTAQARNIWEIRKVQETGEDSLDLGLFHRKAPPFARFSQPLGIHVEFTDGSIKATPQEPRSVREFVAEMGIKAQIRELLATEGALTEEDIVKHTDGNPSSVHTILYSMRKKGVIDRLPDKRWGLMAREM